MSMWTFCFSCDTAERGGAEERKSPAGRRVCHRSRWCQGWCKMYLFSLSFNSLLLTFEMSIFNLFFSHVSPLLQEVFLQQASWNRAASTWTPRASSLSTRYLTKPGSLSESVFVPFLLIHSSKLPPRWCRQMLMGSLPEEMWWSFLSRHATTRRWTSLTGKWLMYTVSVSQLDPQRLHI